MHTDSNIYVPNLFYVDLDSWYCFLLIITRRVHANVHCILETGYSSFSFTCYVCQKFRVDDIHLFSATLSFLLSPPFSFSLSLVLSILSLFRRNIDYPFYIYFFSYSSYAWNLTSFIKASCNNYVRHCKRYCKYSTYIFFYV